MGQGDLASGVANVNDPVSPATQNGQATNPGTRFGKGGKFPGESDASNETIITKSSPGV